MQKILSILKVLFLFCCGGVSSAQLSNNGATIYIGSGVKLMVQGDVIANADILGSGTLLLKNTSAQVLSMNGYKLSNLEIDNTGNVLMGTGSLVINNNLSFINGKIKTGSNNVILTEASSITGASSTSFIWTDGSGQLHRYLTADVSNLLFPVGENNTYRPAYLTTSGAVYSGAAVSVRLIASNSVNRPPMIANSVNAYWPVTRTGITGGTVRLTGQYADGDIIGSEGTFVGYYFNGTDWVSSGETHNSSLNQISVPVTVASGELAAMNKFLSAGSKIFLQGAYNPSTGLMSDALRTGTNLIPLSDPYRTAPYNSYFTHSNNSIAETANPSVFNNQSIADNDIVDWVFLELRTTAASPGNTILQTRSALLQRDGDIVDVDGTSPVTFNNLADGNYTLAVRHRNHLGLSTDAIANPRSLSEMRSTAFTSKVIDLRTATDAQLYGMASAYTTAMHPVLGNINMLWAGNINGNNAVRYQGPSNDRAAMLSDLGNNELNTLPGYYRSDINFNRIARYSGPSNDRAYLLSAILLNGELITRTESLPN